LSYRFVSATLIAGGSHGPGKKRPNDDEDDEDDEDWIRPSKRLVADRRHTDLDDVFTGPFKAETSTEYVIAPPPPATTTHTRVLDISDKARSSAPASVVLMPVVPATIPGPTTAVSVITSTPVSVPSLPLASIVSPPAVSAPILPAPVVTPAIAALDSLNISLMPALHDLMETLRWGCPNHYILGIDEPMEHKATTCSLGKCNNSDEGWKTWRKGLHFMDGCCFGCGVENNVSFITIIIIVSDAHGILQRTFTDELGEAQRLIHIEPMGVRCPYSETLRAMAWVIYSTPTLRTAYEQSIWRGRRGLDSIPAVPFVRWLGLNDSSSGLNLYTVGFFALTLRGQPRASTSFPMY